MSDDTATQDTVGRHKGPEDPPPDGSGGPDDSERVAPGDVELSEQEIAEIEEERQRRTAAENRPEGAEVDNTDRDFDPIEGKFEDSDHATAGPYNPPGEG